MEVWCDAQLEGQMLFWDGRSRLSDGRTGVGWDGRGWYWGWKYLSIGAVVRKQLGWRRVVRGAVGGGGGGMAVVGGGDGWLEGDKSVDDQATFSNTQHPPTTLNSHPQPPS